MEIIDRIKMLIDEVMPEGSKNDNSFAKSINMEQKTVNNYMNGTNKPSLKFVEAILKSFPNVSAEWLMREEGGMFKSINQSVNGVGNNIQAGGNVSHVSAIGRGDKSTAALIAQLKGEVEYLRSKNDQLLAMLSNIHLN